MNVHLTWAGDLASQPKEAQSQALDREVESFSQWLSRLPDSRASGALNNPERALIKTYLIQKLQGNLDKDN